MMKTGLDFESEKPKILLEPKVGKFSYLNSNGLTDLLRSKTKRNLRSITTERGSVARIAKESETLIDVILTSKRSQVPVRGCI